MGRSPSSSKRGVRHEAWTANEDKVLRDYIRIHGDGGWTNLPLKAGLNRSGKSCRLRWLNYLRPDIKRGNISSDEEELIIRLHRILGNRWSLIAGRLPGRTDNEIKNYWNTHLSKTRNLKDRSTSPSPRKNHVFKPTARKVKTAERGCNGYGSNEVFRLCNVKGTTKSPISLCDLLLSDSDNLVETEERNSMSSLAKQRSRHCSYFAGETATLADNSWEMNELLSPNCNLLSSPLDYSLIDFRLEEFYEEQSPFPALETNQFEEPCCDQTNVQHCNGLTVSNDPTEYLPQHTKK